MESTFNIAEEYITKYYFTKIFLWATVVTALFYCFKKNESDRLYKILKTYLGLELSLGLIDNIISPNPNINTELKPYFINFSNSFITLIEFYFFSQLSNKIFYKSNKRKLNGVFLFTLIILWTAIAITTVIYGSKHLLRLTYFLGSIEFLFILYLSIDYFIHQLNGTPVINLFKRGSFWCFAGSLFYSAISAPFYIIGPSFPTGNANFDLLLPALLYYLPYSILFICITIALKCKTQIWN